MGPEAEQEATQPVAKTAIAFSADLPEEQTVTRAGTPLSETVTTFEVWGYKNMSYNDGTGVYDNLQTVMPAYTVNWVSGSAATTTSNSSGWEYVAQQASSDEQSIKYWDFGAKAYRFFAVTGFATHEPNEPNGPHVFTIAANCSGADDAAVAANIAATPFYSHLWFSNGNPTDYPTRKFGQPVLLEFLKPYARVRFLFKYSYEVEGIKLKNKSFKPTDGSKIVRKGTFTVSYPLMGTATSESFTITNIDADASLEAFTEDYITDGTEKWYFVLPNTSQGSYTLSVSVNGDTKNAVVPAEYMQWLPGYSYTYIFKITDQGGVEIAMVQSAVTPWTEMETNHAVYNW